MRYLLGMDIQFIHHETPNLILNAVVVVEPTQLLRNFDLKPGHIGLQLRHLLRLNHTHLRVLLHIDV